LIDIRERARRSVVRLWRGTDTIVGVGFLVGQRQVLTCAHVVARALGLPDETTRPEGAIVALDFPFLAHDNRYSASVAVWLAAEAGGGGGDVAGLVLDRDPPSGAKPAILVTIDNLWGRSFRAFGFPVGAGGDWARGILRDTQAYGWLQLESSKLTGRRVQAGYSGAAVWAEDEPQGVVGMVVQADRGPGDRVAYAIPASLLIQTWPEVLRGRPIPANPYRGLESFHIGDEKIFFGRDDVIARLKDAVHRQSLIAVIGPSGSGKSSVVRAGLLSAITSRGDSIIAEVRFRLGSTPLEALAGSLVQAADPETELANYLRRSSQLEQELRRYGRLDKVVDRLLSRSKQRHVLIVADQFEELYTLCHDEHERAVFLDILLDAVVRHAKMQEPALTVLLTMRADFLNQALLHEGFANVLQGTIDLLGPMTRAQLRLVIAAPAGDRGVTFAEGLVDRMLDDVGEGSGRLPLLEFALTQLWQQQKNGQISHDAYQAVGGVKGALTQHAEHTYENLSPSEQQAARRVFAQLVMPGDGTADTRRVAYRTDLREEDWPIVQRLADARLVVTDRDDRDQERVQVAHEALIERWDRLRAWISADRPFMAWRERMRAAVSAWEASQYDEGALLRGVLLTEAKHWASERPSEIEERIFDLLRQSRAAEAQALRSRAESLAERGDAKGAIRDWEESIAIFQELGDRKGEAETLSTLALLHASLALLDQAITLSESSLTIYRELADHEAEVKTLDMLAELHARQGRPRAAMTSWAQKGRLLSDQDRWWSLTEVPGLTLQFADAILRRSLATLVLKLVGKFISLVFNAVSNLIGVALMAGLFALWILGPPYWIIQGALSSDTGHLFLISAVSGIVLVLWTDGFRLQALVAYPVVASLLFIVLASTFSTIGIFIGTTGWPSALIDFSLCVSLWALLWWCYQVQRPAVAQPYLHTLVRPFRWLNARIMTRRSAPKNQSPNPP
jgi:tetratricopeptide (TPR) repeat protein